MKNCNRFVIYFCMASLVFMGACSSMKGLFSKGQDELKAANEAWKSGDELQALVHATQSIIIDPEFYQGKTFVKDRFDPTILKAKQQLMSLDNPGTSAQAEQKHIMLGKLVKLYDNLRQIKLPLKHPKGKWSWHTGIVDYTQDLEVARKQTFDLLLAEGRTALAAGQLKESETAFRRAVREFAMNEAEKTATSAIIADEMSDYASRFMQTRVIEEAVIANSFYKSALKFVSAHPAANVGVSASAALVASLYHERGLALEQSKEIEKMIASVEEYKSAIKWEGKNAVHQEALTRVTTSIAEYYYSTAMKAEKAKDFPTAIANYESTRKWIADYKDAMSRMYNLRIGGKIDLLAKNLSDTKVQHSKFESRVNTVSGYVDSSADVMGKITYVSDHTRSLNTTMKSTASTLKAFAIIPVVGTTTNILAKSIDVTQNPVGVVAGKFDAFEEPIITPTKKVVDQTKVVVDNVKGKMGTTGTTVQTAQEYTLRLKDCVSKMVEENNLKEAEVAIDELNKGLVNVNKSMATMDGSLAKVETQGKKIAAMSSNISKVTNGLKTVGKAVDKVQPVVNQLNAVLDKEFGVMSYKFSARKILNGVSGPAKWVMDKLSDLVMVALKPVLKQFDIDIPSVPGISDLAKQLDQFKDIYSGLQAEVDAVKKTAADYANYQQAINSNFTKLQKAVGCELAAAN